MVVVKRLVVGCTLVALGALGGIVLGARSRAAPATEVCQERVRECQEANRELAGRRLTDSQICPRTQGDAGCPVGITAEAFYQQPVTGRLDAPLGTIVRVTGTAIDGDTTRRRADLGKTLLSIETVNGLALAKAAVFTFHRAAKDVKKPDAGDRFDYFVHEYGKFDGVVDVPKGLGIEPADFANSGFHYRSFITVHRSNTD